MKVFAISDLHLSFSTDKPMNIFGPQWEGHWDIIVEDWEKKVSDDDIVLLSGDLSWAMKIEDAIIDIGKIAELKGKKIIIKGNHDYWWNSYNKVKSILSPNMYALQNNSIKIGNYIIAGSRGWIIAEDEACKEENKKIYQRELIRLEMSLQDMTKKRNTEDIVIAMCHYPPFSTNKPTSVTKLMNQYNVDKVIYGHLHHPANPNRKTTIDKIDYYLTSCDLLENKLLEIY